jgi:hypothetical protein
VPIPPEIEGIRYFIQGRFPDLQHTIFIATLLHSVGWTDEDIFYLDEPSLGRLIFHSSSNSSDYLTPVGSGLKKKMKGSGPSQSKNKKEEEEEIPPHFAPAPRPRPAPLRRRSEVSRIPRRTVPVANPAPVAPLSPELYGMRSVSTPFPDDDARFIRTNSDDEMEWEITEVPQAPALWVPTEEHRRIVRQQNVRPLEEEQEELMFKEKIESFNMFVNELSQRTGRSTQFIKDSFDDYLQTVLGITVERCLRSTPDQIDSILINFARRYYRIRL